MTRSFIFASLMVTMLAGPALARQDGGGGGGGGGFGGGQSGLPPGIDAPRTIPQQIASKLKLDKTQSPQVDQILTAAAAEAAPHAQQLLLIRQRLVNASRANRPEDVKAGQDAYAAAAAQIAGIEAKAWSKVYAVLKPNQQKEAPAAFVLMAGLLSNPPDGGARSGGRGPGGTR